MRSKGVPAIAFGAIAGTLTYLLAGVPALVLTWIASQDQARLHGEFLFRYWVTLPWIAGAISVALMIAGGSLIRSRHHLLSWSRWALWGLLPAFVYVGVVAAVAAATIPEDPIGSTVAYVVLYAFIDGSFWIALLTPLIARQLVMTFAPKAAVD